VDWGWDGSFGSGRVGGVVDVDGDGDGDLCAGDGGGGWHGVVPVNDGGANTLILFSFCQTVWL